MILTMQLTTMQTQVTLACHKNSGGLNEKERDELKDYAGKIKKEILQKWGFLREAYVIRNCFVLNNASEFPVRLLCRVIRMVTHSVTLAVPPMFRARIIRH